MRGLCTSSVKGSVLGGGLTVIFDLLLPSPIADPALLWGSRSTLVGSSAAEGDDHVMAAAAVSEEEEKEQQEHQH